jgi:hypothetical protein
VCLLGGRTSPTTLTASGALDDPPDGDDDPIGARQNSAPCTRRCPDFPSVCACTCLCVPRAADQALGAGVSSHLLCHAAEGYFVPVDMPRPLMDTEVPPSRLPPPPPPPRPRPPISSTVARAELGFVRSAVSDRCAWCLLRVAAHRCLGLWPRRPPPTSPAGRAAWRLGWFLSRPAG